MFPVSAATVVLSAGVALAALLTGEAAAQSINANSAAYNAGYGRFAGEENQPVQAGVRDANGNLVILDGLIQTGPDHSGFSAMATAGAFATLSGVSAGGGSPAVVNKLQVVPSGSNNTVIVNSQQTNTGNVSASSTHWPRGV